MFYRCFKTGLKTLIEVSDNSFDLCSRWDLVERNMLLDLTKSSFLLVEIKVATSEDVCKISLMPPP